MNIIYKVLSHFDVDKQIWKKMNNYPFLKLHQKKKICRYLKRALIILHPETSIGENIRFEHPQNIVIGKGSIIGSNVTIYQNVTIGQKKDHYPIVGNNVVIYPGAIVIGNITIGNNCIIGAGSVVTKSFGDNCIIAGNPAKCIGLIHENK